MRNERIIIRLAIQGQVLDQTHAGHQDIQKCRDRARQSVWWPGLFTEVQDLVSKCHTCCQHQSQKTEPVIPTVVTQLMSYYDH